MAKRKTSRSKSDIPNAALANALKGLGFEIQRTSDASGPLYKIEGTSASVSRLVGAIDAPEYGEDARRKIKDDGLSAFRGGTFADLQSLMAGNVDMSAFMVERQRFAESGLEQKLQARIAELFPRRRRRMSEHDGEWNYDRRWEIQPFQATQRVASPGKTLDIVCDFTIDARTQAKEIARYGAVAWAICDIVESAGISTSITIQAKTKSAAAGTKKNVRLNLLTQVKKAGQYIAPSLLATVFQPLFYRRPLFGLMVLGANLENLPAHRALGICDPEIFRRIKYEDGRLLMSPNVHMAGNSEIEREILAAIGAAKTEGMAA